jgi:hypothetical protein
MPDAVLSFKFIQVVSLLNEKLNNIKKREAILRISKG